MDGRIDLERARRDAKALLRAARAGDEDARARMRSPRLADAQHAVAVSLGASSWPALVREVEAGDALIAAARAGSAADVYRLLCAGAPANARDRETGGTALHVAAAGGFADVVDALAGWVPLDRRAVDRAGRTALERSGDAVVTRMLSAPPAPAWDEALGERAWEAEAALFSLLSRSPLAERRPVGDGFAFRTGLADNTRNGVVASRAGDADEVVRWLGAPAQWLVPANAGWTPPGEPERTAVFMAAPLAVVPGGGGEAGAVEISEVRDAPSLAAALAAVDALDFDAREAELLASLGFAGPLRHFAALRCGAPVGIVGTLVSGTTLYGTSLAVGPRRQGIGRALVLHALREARGCDVALLSPTPATIPFYAALGFNLYRFPADRTFYVR